MGKGLVDELGKAEKGKSPRNYSVHAGTVSFVITCLRSTDAGVLYGALESGKVFLPMDKICLKRFVVVLGILLGFWKQ